MGKTLTIIVNVKNNQESYYQYIDLFLKCDERKVENILQCEHNDKLRYFLSEEQIGEKKDFQRHSNTIERMLENRQLSKMTSLEGGIPDISRILLYFRLHMDTRGKSASIAENEVTNLQYYFLIKQYIEQGNCEDTLPVYCQLLIDNVEKNEIRYKFGQFLLFESKKETPVFLKNESREAIRQYGYAVNLPGAGPDSNYGISSLGKFCPLLEICKETYDLLSGTVEAALVKLNESCERPQGMPARSNRSYMDMGMGIGNILMDMCAFYYTEGNSQPEKEKRMQFFHSAAFWNEVKGMTLLSFLILCSFEYYLIELYRETEQEGIELSINDLQKKINTVNNLSSGLIQIIENVVAHTKYRKGYFCFRIHRSDSDYLQKNYQKYLVQMGESMQCSMFLEVKVCDCSLAIRARQHSSVIVERFMENLQKRAMAETEIGAIYPNFHGITVKDFYLIDQANTGYEESWRQYYAIQKNWLYHYGLKLYARVVKKANGFFEVNSQNCLETKSEEQYYSTIEMEAGQTNHLPGTQYSVVLPYFPERASQRHIGIDSEIAYDEMLRKLFQNKIRYNQESILVMEALKDRILLKKEPDRKAAEADAEQTAESFDLQADKERYAKEVVAIVREEYEKLMEEQEPCENDECQDSGDVIKTLILDVGNLRNSFWQEIVAKAIWIYICNGDAGESFYCALEHCSFEFIQYLTNTIGIYFGLNPGNEIKMEYQLYICNAQSEEDFLISGSNLSEIRSRAYKFAVSRGIFPHALTYLFADLGEMTDRVERSGNSLEVIPFDLLMKKDGEFLFHKLIKSVMENEIYYLDYGCKLPNIHIRLGSKIHIRNFYEAEILFQDSYFSKRMAYFVVRDIMKKIEERPAGAQKHLVLVGYENYSETFIYDVHKFLQERLEEHASPYLLESYTICFDINGTLEFSGLDYDGPYEDLEFIIIVSLNSTLTTYNKIKAALEKRTGRELGSLNIFANYAVILLRDDYIQKYREKRAHLEEEGIRDERFAGEYPPAEYKTDVEKRFWVSIDDEKKIVKGRYVDKEITYFISEVTEWEEPLSCPMCFPENNAVGEKALIDTNKISIIPAMQYGLIKKPSDSVWVETIPSRKRKEKAQEKQEGWDREDEENQKKLERLANHVKYGHIKRNDNHFLFYFDTKELFDDCKNEIRAWLQQSEFDQLKNSDADGQHYFGIYNVLVTPVHESNTGFIELINDCIFRNAAYIVRFDINKMYRNNLMARYSNLTLLYRRIIETAKEIGGQAKINLYYVDDTIVSGKTFERASSLMKSLYRETWENMGHLSEAVEVNIFEGCFLLLNRLSQESIKGLAGEDCKYYSYFDLPISLIRNHKNFCFMCNVIENANQLRAKSATNEIAQRWRKVEKRFQLKEYYDKEYYCSEEYQRKLERYRKRFYATYWSSLELKRLGEGAENTKQVCHMIVERLLVKHMQLHDKDALSESEQLEILFSYVKVLSRPFFNSNWRSREAIFSLILVFLEVFLNKDVKSIKKYKEITDQFDYLEGNSEIYQICGLINKYSNVKKASSLKDVILVHNMLMVLVKQAMELNSNYIIRKDNLARIVNKNKEIITKLDDMERKEPLDASYQKTIKSIRNFNSTFIIYVKQLIALSGDEKKNIWMEKLLLTGNEYISEETEPDWEFVEDYGFHSRLGQGLYIENIGAIKDAFDDIGREILREWGPENSEGEVHREPGLLSMEEIEVTVREKLKEILASTERYYLNSFYEILQINGFAEYNDETGAVRIEEKNFHMLQEIMKLYVILTQPQVEVERLEEFYKNMMACFASILESRTAQCLVIVPSKSYCLLEIEREKDFSYKLKEGGNHSVFQGKDLREEIKTEGMLKTFGFIGQDYLFVTFESDTDIQEYEDGQEQQSDLEMPMSLRPLYFVFDIRQETGTQKKAEIIKKLRFILTMREYIVKNIERDFKNNSFQEMIEEKNKKIQLSEWKTSTHSSGEIYSDVLRSMNENRERKEALQDEGLKNYVETLEGAALRLLSDSNISSKYHAILTGGLASKYAVRHDKIQIKVADMDFEECIVSLYRDSLINMPQENRGDIVCAGIKIHSMERKRMIYFFAEQEGGTLILIPILQNALKHCAYGKEVEVYCGEEASFVTKEKEKMGGLHYLCIANPIANPEQVSVERMYEFVQKPIGERIIEDSGRKNGISLYAVNQYLERLVEVYYNTEIDFEDSALKLEMKDNVMIVKLPVLQCEKEF